jgi:hypothetical protein
LLVQVELGTERGRVIVNSTGSCPVNASAILAFSNVSGE